LAVLRAGGNLQGSPVLTTPDAPAEKLPA
jgi:hypothetical protein